MAEQISFIPNEPPKRKPKVFRQDQLPRNELLVGPDPTPQFVQAVEDAGGIWSPIQVTEHEDGSLEVTAGRRRLKTMRLLWDRTEDPRFQMVPAVVTYADANYAAIMTVQDQELQKPNPVAEYDAIVKLMIAGLDEQGIVKKTGIPAATVKKRLRLRNLHVDLLEAFQGGRIAVSVAEAMLSLSEAAQRRLVAKLAESGTITLNDVKEQKSANVQAAAAALGPGLFDGMPDAEDVAEDRPPVLNEEARKAADHLRRRSDLAFQRTVDRAPRWTREDSDQLRRLLEGIGYGRT